MSEWPTNNQPAGEQPVEGLREFPWGQDERVVNVEADFAAVIERMRRSRAGISPHDSSARFRKPGVDVFPGAGQFAFRERLDEPLVCMASLRRNSMSFIQPKPLMEYPFYLRWFFRRQARKYGQTLAPSWLWGRLPGHLFGLLFLLGLFQRKRFAVDAALRSLVSVRVAQLNGCAFCVDLNAYNLLQATGSAAKAQAVHRWRESELYSERERAVLDYAEAMTDAARSVTREQIAALKTHFDDDGVVALTAWIAFQNFSAKFNSALGAEENGLCQLPGKATQSGNHR